jgi:hypothetical protein
MLDYFTKLSGTVVADLYPKISEELRQPLLFPTLLVTSFDASTSHWKKRLSRPSRPHVICIIWGTLNERWCLPLWRSHQQAQAICHWNAATVANFTRLESYQYYEPMRECTLGNFPSNVYMLAAREDFLGKIVWWFTIWSTQSFILAALSPVEWPSDLQLIYFDIADFIRVCVISVANPFRRCHCFVSIS